MRAFIRAILALSVLLPRARAQAPAEISLEEALRLAERNSPRLEASRFRETAAESSVGVARAGYLPTLEWDEMDSSRFPESSRQTGVGGLIGSPYRSGRVSAAVAKETLWDFGRTSHGVEAARGDSRSAREDVLVTLYQVDEETLSAYYDCARARSQGEALEELAKEIRLVAKEVVRFVKTGQTSVVARYLVFSQIEETETAQADFKARLNAATRRLSIFTGLTDSGFACPHLPERAEEPLRPKGPFHSPLVSRAAAEAEAARARLKQAQAGRYPRLLAAGTAGSLDASGIKDKGAYAFAAGISLPLFDGLKTTSEIERARALAAQKEKDLEAAKQRLAELNSRYDEVIESAQGRLEHLGHELSLAQEGFDVAKKRYLSLQGDVVDLREALRNLIRTRTEINDAKAELLKALGGKALVNGAY